MSRKRARRRAAVVKCAAGREAQRFACFKVWNDFYDHVEKSELAVSRKKVLEVEEAVLGFYGQGQRRAKVMVFVLVGPSGCGKTALVKALCRNAGIDLVQWSNDAHAVVTADHASGATTAVVGTSSQLTDFSDFLHRSCSYQSVVDVVRSEGDRAARRLVLVEELPLIFVYRPDSFRQLLLQTLAKQVAAPLVFIFSQDSKVDNQELWKHVFNEQLESDPRIRLIFFSPVSDTSMGRCLKQIIQKLPPEVSANVARVDLDSVIRQSHGDIRAAINSLRFAGRQPTAALHDCEKDVKLVLFHALGKFLYGKCFSNAASDDRSPKLGTPDAELSDSLSPEEILQLSGVDDGLFTMFLHENYLDMRGNLDDVVAISDAFSLSDRLAESWNLREACEIPSANIPCRSVALHCQNIKKTGFKQMRKPAWLSVTKSAAVNLQQMSKFANSYFHRHVFADESLRTELVPMLALRRADPSGVCAALRSAFCNFGESSSSRGRFGQMSNGDANAIFNAKSEPTFLIEDSDEEVVIEQFD